MPNLDVDFDVWKALTLRRDSEEMTYNDVLRDLLGLASVEDSLGAGTGWTWKGVNLPNGTELRAEYKGKEYTAKIIQDSWMQNGDVKNSPSHAAWSITQAGVNGWTFWQVRRPDSDQWISLNSLRKK